MASTCNCYALLKRKSRCAFGDNIGRLLVNFDDGSLVSRFPAPGNHGDREKKGIALLVAQGTAAADIVLIEHPAHTQFGSEQVTHNDPHGLQFAGLVRSHQWLVQQRLQ